MTRTERASYPRALMKDRSESRSGLDTNIRKSGGGQHNWGKINDEYQIEALADEEVRREEEEEGLTVISPGREVSPDATLANRITVVRSRSPSPASTEQSSAASPSSSGRARATSMDDVEQARKFRKKLFKKSDVDLSDIARTSAAVRGMSPPNRITISDDTIPLF